MRAKDLLRLNQLVVRSADQEERRRREWIFVSQEAVARALGAPDQVEEDDDETEEWEYWIPFRDEDGEPDEYSLEFSFRRGRVIDVSGADPIAEED
jgi:hypothetical protein